MHPLDIRWAYTFGSVALVAGASLIGILALSFSPKRLSRAIPLLVSLAAGALLGTAFCHLLPESMERIGSARNLSGLLIAGFVTFFVLEKSLRVWHGSSSGNRPAVTNLLAGAAIHSFIDGMALATAYAAGTHLGAITTIAVLFHEAPHHIGDVSILIHKGVPVVRAVVLNLLAAATVALGALLVLLAGEKSAGVTVVLLPFTTANFLYIASVTLLPELQGERGLRQSAVHTLFLVAGCSLAFVSAA